MFKALKKKMEDKKYKKYKKLVNHPEFVYDIDTQLFVAIYEKLQDSVSQDKKFNK